MSEKAKKKSESPTRIQVARLTKRTLSHKKRMDPACPWLVPPTGSGRRSPLWEIGGR